MPLTEAERAFLDAYVYEATNGPPFGGPATTDLSRRGIWYSDLSWILTAYQRELSAEGTVPSGVRTPAPPPSPWESLEQVKLRNEVLRGELQVMTSDTKRETAFNLEEAERTLATERDAGRPLPEIWRDLEDQRNLG